jgi:AcrR family transcriptional regulator
MISLPNQMSFVAHKMHPTGLCGIKVDTKPAPLYSEDETKGHLLNNGQDTHMSVAERRAREKQYRIQDILVAAEKVFFKKGFESATMNEIAREAELGKGTIYLYFKGKDDVHRAIVEKGMDILYGLIKSSTGNHADGMSKLETVWDSFMRFRTDYPNYCNAFIHYETKPREGNEAVEIDGRVNKYKVINFMIAAIEEGRADGSVRSDINAADMTLMLWAQMTGAIMLVRFKSALITHLSREEPEDFLERFKRLTYENLGSR